MSRNRVTIAHDFSSRLVVNKIHGERLAFPSARPFARSIDPMVASGHRPAFGIDPVPDREEALRGAIPDWQKYASSLVEKIGLAGRVATLERTVQVLSARLRALEESAARPAPQAIVVTLSTLAPEPFELIAPISVVLQEEDEGFTAMFLEANLGATGETRGEAIDGIKDRIVTTFERLSKKQDAGLGPGPLKQKRVLESLLRSC